MDDDIRRDDRSIALLERIVETPGTCGGRPRVAGTRIRVRDLVGRRDLGDPTVEELLDRFPSLTRADIDAAHEYYLLHAAEIDRQIRDDLEFCLEMMERWPSIFKEKYDRLRDDPEADPELVNLLREGIEDEAERLAELKEELRQWKAVVAANDSLSSLTNIVPSPSLRDCAAWGSTPRRPSTTDPSQPPTWNTSNSPSPKTA